MATAILNDHDRFRLERLDREEREWAERKSAREARKALLGTVVPVTKLALGDVVRIANLSEADAPYSSCTVINVQRTNKGDVLAVTLFRPYVHTADFSMSGGSPDALAVISYIGSETFTLSATNTVKLLQLGEALK